MVSRRRAGAAPPRRACGHIDRVVVGPLRWKREQQLRRAHDGRRAPVAMRLMYGILRSVALYCTVFYIMLLPARSARADVAQHHNST